MTILKKPVSRQTNGKVHECGQYRDIVVIIRPPNILGFRAKGCRKEYCLTAEALYTMAVRAAVMAEKRAKGKK